MVGLWISCLRGGAEEARHGVAAVLVDSLGRVVERIGEPTITTWRSAAKPFQLEVSASLAAESLRAGLSDEDLAVGASSHWGQPRHVERVQALLARGGLAEERLFCGTHWPSHPEAARDLARAGQVATPIHNNCSGKHSFMALACEAQGWPADYRAREHPLQQAILASVEQRCGEAADAVVDGCGVPCFVLGIAGMARAYAQLAVAMKRGRSDLLGRIGLSMHAHPLDASGEGAIDGSLMAVATRPLVCKVGAMGLICGAMQDEGYGFAIKVLSGSDEARAVAVHRILARWAPGLIPADAATDVIVVKNHVGRVCGERVAVWDRDR